jgi:hypothetical protein
VSKSSVVESMELATLIYEESDRLMRDVFVEQLFRKEKQTWESNWDLLDQTKFVHWLCREYRVFLRTSVENSTDWLRRYIANFILLMDKYYLFCEAERSGDAPMMELITTEFLPVFQVTKKTTMIRTLTRIMEIQYDQRGHVLQQMRINRTRRQRGGLDSGGNDTPNKGLDDHMERLMPPMKKFSHAGNFATWTRVSMECMFGMKSKSFADFYTRLRSDAEKELNERKLELDIHEIDEDNLDIADVPGCRKKTTKPGKRSRDNKVLVMEILTRAGIHVEVENRAVNNNQFWSAIDITETEVRGLTNDDNNPAAAANSRFRNTNIVAAADAVINQLTAVRAGPGQQDGEDLELQAADERSLFSTRGEDSDVSSLDSNADDNDNDSLDDNGDDLEEDVLERNVDETLEDEDEWLVVPDTGDAPGEEALVEKAKKKSSSAAFNMIGTTDFWEIGRAKLLAKYLGPGRLAAKKRKIRSDYVTKQLLFEKLETMEADVSATVKISVGDEKINKLKTNQRFARLKNKKLLQMTGNDMF